MSFTILDDNFFPSWDLKWMQTFCLYVCGVRSSIEYSGNTQLQIGCKTFLEIVVYVARRSRGFIIGNPQTHMTLSGCDWVARRDNIIPFMEFDFISLSSVMLRSLFGSRF
jgi:hypothetical protein